MNWSTKSAAVITGVIRDNPGVTGKALFALVDAAYPFGLREHHPYKMWLRERRRLLGAHPRKTKPGICKDCQWAQAGNDTSERYCSFFAKIVADIDTCPQFRKVNKQKEEHNGIVQ